MCVGHFFSLNHSAHCLIYILHLHSNLVDNLVFCSLTDWLVKADANVLFSFSVFPFSISSAIKLGFDCMWHVLLLLFFSSDLHLPLALLFDRARALFLAIDSDFVVDSGPGLAAALNGTLFHSFSQSALNRRNGRQFSLWLSDWVWVLFWIWEKESSTVDRIVLLSDRASLALHTEGISPSSNWILIFDSSSSDTDCDDWLTDWLGWRPFGDHFCYFLYFFTDCLKMVSSLSLSRALSDMIYSSAVDHFKESQFSCFWFWLSKFWFWPLLLLPLLSSGQQWLRCWVEGEVVLYTHTQFCIVSKCGILFSAELSTATALKSLFAANSIQI